MVHASGTTHVLVQADILEILATNGIATLRSSTILQLVLVMVLALVLIVACVIQIGLETNAKSQFALVSWATHLQCATT